MSDVPRDRQPDDPTAGPDQPGRSTEPGRAKPAQGTEPGRGTAAAGDSADEPVTGPPSAGANGDRGRGGGLFGWLRTPGRHGTPAGPESDPRRRRQRRWFVAGISAGAALVVVALCAGTVGVVSAVSGYRERGADIREDQRLRDGDCLGLEQRLNQLVPPGATTTPQARAIAVRDENAAVRIYVNAIRDRRGQDGWRQLLDARTAYAEALDLQAKSRTPAFFVAPRTPEGQAVADQLVRWSPAACAGPIRRLSAPGL